MDIILGIIAALLLIAWLDSHEPSAREVDRLSMHLGPTMAQKRRR